MTTAKPVGQLLKGALTEIQEPPTKVAPQDTILKRFKRIANFETRNHPQLERALDSTAKFAASINFTRPYWLTLAGGTGVGKTHLARKVLRQFLDQNRFELKYNSFTNQIIGNTWMWVDWRTFCASIRSGAYELIEDVCNEWFVVLDDIGSERDSTGFIAEATDRIFNSRRQKWTLITTNLLLKDVASKIDVRVADRMLRDGGEVIEIECDSFAQR